MLSRIFNSGVFVLLLTSTTPLKWTQGPPSGVTNGWIELVLIEARDLIAADLRGTSDPFVRVNYGNLKKRTKVRNFIQNSSCTNQTSLRFTSFITITLYLLMVLYTYTGMTQLIAYITVIICFTLVRLNLLWHYLVGCTQNYQPSLGPDLRVPR